MTPNLLLSRTLALLLAVLCGTCLTALRSHADFALHDGDRVVFLGDSITAARGYTKTVELYTLMRFPERRVTFFNAGAGGDTASGSLSRLDRDVFSHRPTVVTVAFGINDIGWGTKADDAHKKAYLDALRTIIGQCQAHGARPIICSAAITDTPPDEAESGYLQRMTDEGLALAKSLGAEAVDLQRGMRAIQRKVAAANVEEKDPAKRTRLHLADGVHPNELGHLVMAYALLKGLDAPADVSSVTLDAAHPEVPATASGCRVTDLKPRADGGVEFTRLDDGLPVNFGVFGALNFRWIPVPDELDQYMLTVRNLPPGEYEITAEGRSLGKEKSERLAAGLNICSSTGNGFEPGGPWDAQANVVRKLVDTRSELSASEAERVHFLSNHPQSATLAGDAQKLDDGITVLERATAKPYPYHFVIQRVP